MCVSDSSFARHSAWGARLVGLALAITATVAHAQADKDAEQIKRLRLQMRQVQQQQQETQEARAKADQARQQAEASLKAQEGELHKQRGAATTASRRAASLAKELDALKPDHERALAELAALKVQHQALLVASHTAQSKAGETEALLRSELSQTKARLERATADNVTLSRLGLELLQRYESKGIGEVLSANEPFVQSGRVKLENLKDEYERRIDAARIKGAVVGAPAASTVAPGNP